MSRRIESMLRGQVLLKRTAVEVRKFFSTSEHSKSVQGVLWTWGSGDDCQLGHPKRQPEGIRRTYEELKPRVVEALEEVPVKAISFGHMHSASVDYNGRLYTWGSGRHHVLGHCKDESHDEEIPRIVDALKGVKIVDVTCSDFHTTALDEDGHVYTWGWGGSSFSGVGALGHGDKERKPFPTRVEALVDAGVCVKAVKSGEFHSLAVSDDGELWAWGNGEYGRLGNGSSNSFRTPEPVEFFAELNVEAIAVGHAFCLAYCDNQKLYAWGKNDHGQLGLGASINMDVYCMENYPREVDGLPSLADIGAGHAHAAAVSKDGRLFIWGMKTSLEPQEMTVLAGKHVSTVACGNNFTAALCTDGQLFTSGKGRCSSLGHGDRSTRPQPTRVDEFKQMRVLDIACGFQHMGAIVKSSRAADKDFSMRS